MSQESAIQFFNALAEDQNLQGSLNGLLVSIAPDAVVKFAKENGYEFTSEELTAILQNSEEVSPELLDLASGGKMSSFIRHDYGGFFGRVQTFNQSKQAENSETGSAVDIFRTLTQE
uniref:Nif11 domain-containing protein n=1 Tax=Cyanothece sp. (strain PCC 7425 / ATCC 29141) TaxID=395961 RepID=B8HRE0_CYAP4